jgi:hypothetical protein
MSINDIVGINASLNCEAREYHPRGLSFASVQILRNFSFAQILLFAKAIVKKHMTTADFFQLGVFFQRQAWRSTSSPAIHDT